MKHSPQIQEFESEYDNLRFLSKMLLMLAFVTSLLYLRSWLTSSYFPAGYLALALLIVASAGLLIAWRWESVGGALAVAGGSALALVILFTAEENAFWYALFYSSPFVITGLLTLYCWGKERRELSDAY